MVNHRVYCDIDTNSDDYLGTQSGKVVHCLIQLAGNCVFSGVIY